MMLVLNENVYTLEHGPCDEQTDIYADLIRENGEPFARVLHDEVGGVVIVCRVGPSMGLHEKLNRVRVYETAEHIHPTAYFRAVADVLPSNVLAAQVREFISAPSQAVA